ncbi:MAG: transcription antitermination factor NusB [Acidobacteriota bacterium]
MKGRPAAPPGVRAISPARRRAVEVLREVLERGGRATPLLAERGGTLAPADHDLFRHLVLGVLRRRSSLDAELAAVSRIPLAKLASPLREVLEVALYQLRHLDRVPEYAAVDEAVRHARGSGGDGAGRLVNAILRTLLRRGAPLEGDPRSLDAAGLARRFSHPEFLVERWLQRFGLERTLSLLDVDNSPSGLDLLVNPRRTDRDSLAAALSAQGIETQISALSPLALVVLTGNPLKSPLFAAGHFAIQDVGSQALPLLLPCGDTLVDVAAAPGGKSFAAVALGRARRVVALDRSPARLLRVREARRRLGIEEVAAAAADILASPLPAGRFDRVLYDAPCSGTGTLRKNPEIRYRVGRDAIESLSRAQERGLGAAAALAAPGGFILYATCSLESEENERVVERVLERDSGLEPAAIDAPEGLREFVEGHRLQILPGATNDGFTAHLLRRR